VPRELAESELFGHEVGAFTGAVKRRHGHVEMAHGGTLFLDDVDDLPLEIQPKLLRAIQEREFQRVGGERLLKTDLRIIASTKKDLEVLARENRFRQDLLYRLQVLTIYLPPLRDRRGDILALARHFLELNGREANEPPKVLSPQAEQKLLRHDWPGNVRELRHAVEYAVAVANGPTIQVDDLQLRGSSPAQPDRAFVLNLDDRDELDLRGLQTEIEKETIMWALQKSQGDQGRAAELLKMPRTTLIYRLRQLGLAQSTAVAAQGSAVN
jgi:DNA-binding NtrC family response regulator